ncbi:MAG: hypothetical protein WBQ94_01775 [Terracidiphilus sp.]
MITFGFPWSQAKAAWTGLCAASAVTLEKAEVRESEGMAMVSG